MNDTTYALRFLTVVILAGAGLVIIFLLCVNLILALFGELDTELSPDNNPTTVLDTVERKD